jgi:hypothetical protein
MNYRHCILLGIGAIGSALLKLGQAQLSTFETVTAVDVKEPRLNLHGPYGTFDFIQGDARDLDLLTRLIQGRSGASLIVNMCSGIDYVRIRNHIARFDAAYLDLSASSLNGAGTYDDIMRYTHTRAESARPQWICWGMNPGLVELVARRLMNERPETGTKHVIIYEHDSLHAITETGRIGVGWSPVDLIEEVMVTPTVEIREGVVCQHDTEGALHERVQWGDEIVPSRIVAHEDIWNLHLLPRLATARFFYAFHPSVMSVLEGNREEAYGRIDVPEETVSLTGADRVAVQVLDEDGAGQTLLWETDHAKTWANYRLNAVQYQVCKGVQVALDLLQHTHFGTLTGTYCASNLPISEKDWELIERSFVSNDIEWRSAENLGIGVAG